MSKFTIAAVVAATMVGGAFAACTEDTVGDCVAYDLKISLKSLGPKTISCKDGCGEKSKVAYLDNVTRTLKGYLWACEYDCDTSDALNIVLWDSKNKITLIGLTSTYQTVPTAFKDLMVYGKKATKVAADNLKFTGVNCADETLVDLTAVGFGTAAKTGTSCNNCYGYVKSLSGYTVGSIALTTTGTDYSYTTSEGLCGQTVTEDCGETALTPVALTLCDVCCFSSWCEDGTALESNMVPAAGTWSMKYNKSMVKGSKGIASYVPSYAICAE